MPIKKKLVLVIFLFVIFIVSPVTDLMARDWYSFRTGLSEYYSSSYTKISFKYQKCAEYIYEEELPLEISVLLSGNISIGYDDWYNHIEVTAKPFKHALDDMSNESLEGNIDFVEGEEITFKYKVVDKIFYKKSNGETIKSSKIDLTDGKLNDGEELQAILELIDKNKLLKPGYKYIITLSLPTKSGKTLSSDTCLHIINPQTLKQRIDLYERKFKKAEKEKDQVKIIKYNLKILKEAKGQPFFKGSNRIDIHNRLSDAYEAVGDYSNAKKHLLEIIKEEELRFNKSKSYFKIKKKNYFNSLKKETKMKLKSEGIKKADLTLEKYAEVSRNELIEKYGDKYKKWCQKMVPSRSRYKFICGAVLAVEKRQEKQDRLKRLDEKLIGKK